MKITSLEVIFWFPLKSFSSLKWILLSVLTAFLLCFKDNHKDYVASVHFFPRNYFIQKKKCYILSSSGLRGKYAYLTTSNEETFQIMLLADFFSFFLFHHSMNPCFSRDEVFQFLFLFCTCCFRPLKCSWIMLVYFHNFDFWEESCPETFFSEWNKLVGEDRQMVIEEALCQRKEGSGLPVPRFP